MSGVDSEMVPNLRTSYFDEYDLNKYDEAIRNHPYIDGCNGLLVDHVRSLSGGQRVLDVGAGTGRVVKLLQRLPSLTICALDVDRRCRDYFMHDPELKEIRFYLQDLVQDALPAEFDVAVLRGVFHHIPQSDRLGAARPLLAAPKHVVIADEALAPYESESERRKHCERWYGHVIAESRRRGLDVLADLESDFCAHELAVHGDTVFDHKESVECIAGYFERAGGQVRRCDRIGSYQAVGGGFYVLTISR